MFEAIRRLNTYLGGFRFLWVLGLLAATAGSVMGLIIPQFVQHGINKAFADHGGSATEIFHLFWVVLGLGLAEVLFVLARRFLVIPASGKVEQKARLRFFDYLQQLPVSFHRGIGSGQLQARAVGELSRLRRWIAFGSLQLIVSISTIIAGLVFLFLTSWVLALVYLTAAIPLTIYTQRIQGTFRRLNHQTQQQTGQLATTVEESVQGIRVLKAFGRSGEATSAFAEEATQLRELEITIARKSAGYEATLMALSRGVEAVALAIGLYLVMTGNLQVGALASFFLTISIVDTSIEWVSGLMIMTIASRTAIERHFEILDTPNTITSPASPASLETQQAAELRFERVGMHFPGQSQPLFSDISFTVSPGSTVALVGATGCGKTTLLECVGRLVDPTSGRILLDGVDIRQLNLAQLRREVSATFEDPTLFSTTVRENVLLGTEFAGDLLNPAAEQRLNEALAVAEAGFVYQLPDGVDTPIGEEGLSLSGGQRQRIALARAIATRPRLLLLDDPLSALDVHTEAKVSHQLRRALAHTTALIVAHRSSTVALADQVAFFTADGQLMLGTHQQLLAHDEYRKLMTHPAVEETSS